MNMEARQIWLRELGAPSRSGLESPKHHRPSRHQCQNGELCKLVYVPVRDMSAAKLRCSARGRQPASPRSKLLLGKPNRHGIDERLSVLDKLVTLQVGGRRDNPTISPKTGTHPVIRRNRIAIVPHLM